MSISVGARIFAFEAEAVLDVLRDTPMDVLVEGALRGEVLEVVLEVALVLAREMSVARAVLMLGAGSFAITSASIKSKSSALSEAGTFAPRPLPFLAFFGIPLRGVVAA
jgi:hypothetical protein